MYDELELLRKADDVSWKELMHLRAMGARSIRTGAALPGEYRMMPRLMASRQVIAESIEACYATENEYYEEEQPEPGGYDPVYELGTLINELLFLADTASTQAYSLTRTYIADEDHLAELRHQWVEARERELVCEATAKELEAMLDA